MADTKHTLWSMLRTGWSGRKPRAEPKRKPKKPSKDDRKTN